MAIWGLHTATFECLLVMIRVAPLLLRWTFQRLLVTRCGTMLTPFMLETRHRSPLARQHQRLTFRIQVQVHCIL